MHSCIDFRSRILSGKPFRDRGENRAAKEAYGAGQGITLGAYPKGGKTVFGPGGSEEEDKEPYYPDVGSGKEAAEETGKKTKSRAEEQEVDAAYLGGQTGG